MRILYHHRTMADGAEGIHIREIVAALRTLGHDVRVVALAGDPTEPRPAGGAHVATLRRLIPAFAYEVAEIGYNVIGYRRLMDAIRAFKPDVLYDRYNSYSTAALRAARRAGLPLLLEVNAPVAYERSTYEHLPLKFAALARRYERTIIGGADRVFVVSTPLQRHLVDVVGIDARKIVVLPNGADPDRFVPGRGRAAVRARYGLEDRVVIGFVGILRPWHGIDLLLEAMSAVRASHPLAHLLIVGDGPIQAQLEARAEELGIRADVTFAGRVPHSEVVEHIAAMDVAVSPHATFYASPMKILEYMAMSATVVAPAMDNIRDIVEDGQTGLLFPPRSSVALAAALRTAVDDPELRKRLGLLARRRVIDHFNWLANARQIEKHARALVADRRQSRHGDEGHG